VPSFTSGGGNVLYLVTCGAPPAGHLASVIVPLHEAGWDVCVIATPAALAWFDPDELAKLTGHPVRTSFRRPSDPEFAPLGDVVLVCPATFNTLNKWALGINDTVALGLLNEALGRQVPTYVVPWVNDALAAHPAYKQTLKGLDQPAVTIIKTTGDITTLPSEVAEQLAAPLADRGLMSRPG